MKKALALILGTLSLLMITGCCRFKQCDCVQANVHMKLKPNSAWCDADSLLHRMRIYNDSWMVTDAFDWGSQCEAWVFVNTLPKHMVFYNDTVAVDTLSIYSADIQQPDGNDGCCDCNETVNGFTYRHKGTLFTVTGNELQLPF